MFRLPGRRRKKGEQSEGPPPEEMSGDGPAAREERRRQREEYFEQRLRRQRRSVRPLTSDGPLRRQEDELEVSNDSAPGPTDPQTHRDKSHEDADIWSGQATITVAVRVRPINLREERSSWETVKVVDEHLVVVDDPAEGSGDILRAHRARQRRYAFDYALGPETSQTQLWRVTCRLLIPGVLGGFNATVFAYGATGAGKTFTMTGTHAQPGCMALTLRDLFASISRQDHERRSFRVTLSYIEVYNEIIRDLLAPGDGLELREDPVRGPTIPGTTELEANTAGDVLDLLERGNRNRSQEATAANATSSRSHAVLQIFVDSRERGGDSARVGKLSMIDLAGSERAASTRNRGQRLIEGANINRSLLALGNCINALGDRGGRGAPAHVPYRDSKLTRLLKDSLGGNSRTVMIANVSPAAASFEETLNTLKYASRAKTIKTKVSRNVINVQYHVSEYVSLIAELRAEVRGLKRKLASATPGASPSSAQQPPTRVATPMSAETKVDGVIEVAGEGEEGDGGGGGGPQSSEEAAALEKELRAALQTKVDMRQRMIELDAHAMQSRVEASRLRAAAVQWRGRKRRRGDGAGVGKSGEEDEVEDGDEEEDEDEDEEEEGSEAALLAEDASPPPPHVVAWLNEASTLEQRAGASESRREELRRTAEEASSRLHAARGKLSAVATEGLRRELELEMRVGSLQTRTVELEEANRVAREAQQHRDLVIHRLMEEVERRDAVIAAHKRALRAAGIDVTSIAHQALEAAPGQGGGDGRGDGGGQGAGQQGPVRHSSGTEDGRRVHSHTKFPAVPGAAPGGGRDQPDRLVPRRVLRRQVQAVLEEEGLTLPPPTAHGGRRAAEEGGETGGGGGMYFRRVAPNARARGRPRPGPALPSGGQASHTGSQARGPHGRRAPRAPPLAASLEAGRPLGPAWKGQQEHGPQAVAASPLTLPPHEEDGESGRGGGSVPPRHPAPMVRPANGTVLRDFGEDKEGGRAGGPVAPLLVLGDTQDDDGSDSTTQGGNTDRSSGGEGEDGQRAGLADDQSTSVHSVDSLPSLSGSQHGNSPPRQSLPRRSDRTDRARARGGRGRGRVRGRGEGEGGQAAGTGSSPAASASGAAQRRTRYSGPPRQAAGGSAVVVGPGARPVAVGTGRRPIRRRREEGEPPFSPSDNAATLRSGPAHAGAGVSPNPSYAAQHSARSGKRVHQRPSPQPSGSGAAARTPSPLLPPKSGHNERSAQGGGSRGHGRSRSRSREREGGSRSGSHARGSRDGRPGGAGAGGNSGSGGNYQMDDPGYRVTPPPGPLAGRSRQSAGGYASRGGRHIAPSGNGGIAASRQVRPVRDRRPGAGGGGGGGGGAGGSGVGAKRPGRLQGLAALGTGYAQGGGPTPIAGPGSGPGSGLQRGRRPARASQGVLPQGNERYQRRRKGLAAAGPAGWRGAVGRDSPYGPGGASARP